LGTYVTTPKTYLAFLRGVNVGGKAKLKMADLVLALTEQGLTNVRTYIQSGNILFTSATPKGELVELIKQTIHANFDLSVEVALFTDTQWRAVVAAAPDWWGKDDSWKHNILIMIEPFDMTKTVAAIGMLKPDIEAVEPGNGVLYQSMSKELYGRTTTGKLAASAIYKQMTIRNYNTATKLLSLL
jgi:uncharacterized protein (DUF1697 family)